LNNKFGINFTSTTDGAVSNIGKLSKSLEGLGKAGRSVKGDFRAFQKETRKLNDSFNNLARDGNRTTKVFGSLGAKFNILGKALKGIASIKIGQFLGQATISAMDMVETTHLFEVSMGELAEEVDRTLQGLHEMAGLDLGNLRDRVGTMTLLGKTMGMAADNAKVLALNTNQLSLDMGSLFNVSYQQITEDLRSGLIGQSRTLYKYGIDVTEAAIANEALAQGITKSVRHMTQGEKMMLRHNVIVKQMSLMQGDFAKTFNTPINQLRVFKERIVTLTRTIGYLFVPAFSVIIKLANALAIVLTRVTNLLGNLLGISMGEGAKNVAGLGSINEEFEDMEDGLGGTIKKAKELRKQLAGFDELNIIQTKAPDTDAGIGGLGEIGGSPLNLDLEQYDGLFSKIKDEAKILADDIMGIFSGIFSGINFDPLLQSLGKVRESLKPLGDRALEGLGWLLDNVLTPLANWAITDALPAFFNLLGEAILFLNGVIEIAQPFLIWLWDSFLEPIAGWTGEVIVWVFERLTDLFGYLNENGELTQTILGTIITLLIGDKISKAMPIVGKLFTIFKNGFGLFMELGVPAIAKLGTSIAGLGGKAVLLGAKLAGFLVSPMGLVVVAITAVIAIGVLLWKNWDKIKEFAGNLGKAIKEKFDAIKEVVGNTWTSIAEWAVNAWNKITDTFKNVAVWFGEKFSLAWENIKKPFKAVGKWAADTWDTIKKTFAVIPTWFKDTFTNAWTNVKNVFSTGGKIFDGIKDGIAATFKTVVNGLIGGINRVIQIPFNAINGMLNTIRNVSILGFTPFSSLWGRDPLKVPQIPKLADGGVLDMGQMFIAREAGAELVGNFGNKTAVMNNDDIIHAVTQGVYTAVKSAMGSSNNEGSPIQLVVNVGEDTLVDRVISGVNRRSVIDGKAVITI